MKRGDRWVLEQDYNGCMLVTDGVSFFAEDKQCKVIAEAKSLDAVKHKVLKPKKLDIDAVILGDRYSHYGDDDEFEPTRVHIYAVSGAGAILYELEDGRKDKDVYDALRVFDADKVARFKEINATKHKAEKDMEKLLEGWPKLKAKELRGNEES